MQISQFLCRFFYAVFMHFVKNLTKAKWCGTSIVPKLLEPSGTIVVPWTEKIFEKSKD